jgi:hypothetical protein
MLTFQDEEVHAAAEQLHVQQPCAAEKCFAFSSTHKNAKENKMQERKNITQ